MSIIGQVRDAIGKLNPQEVKQLAERPLRVKLRAGSETGFEQMIRMLLPDTLSEERRRHGAALIQLEGEPDGPVKPEVTIVLKGLPAEPSAFVYQPGREKVLVREVLERQPDLEIPLARAFPIFREETAQRLVQRASFENAAFSVATALPNIAPFLGFIWSPGEFASDTAFLTLNQIRMIFLLAAASDRPVGYTDQKTEIASIITGAFGWRAVARELAGKIPAGGGLIPKAAIAFAGTWVVGASVERLYRVGYGYTRAERSEAYAEAFQRGKDIAASILDRWRARKPS
jgi:hypothetical protein